jgi:hypothetical protein
VDSVLEHYRKKSTNKKSLEESLKVLRKSILFVLKLKKLNPDLKSLDLEEVLNVCKDNINAQAEAEDEPE